jgi:hypothetical protein
MHDRKQELALQTRKLTLSMLVKSATMILDGDDGDWRFPGELE